jgi:5-methyltetrahydrofolate--homocysteine methyltransferase
VVIGTVLGDVHDIGKNLVSWMLEGAGFRVVDMGVDVPPETFIQAVQSEKPHIVALSSLLTTSAHQIGGVIESLKRNALREQVKVLIGGASVNQAFADRIGADGYALDAATAVSKAKELLGTAK